MKFKFSHFVVDWRKHQVPVFTRIRRHPVMPTA